MIKTLTVDVYSLNSDRRIKKHLVMSFIVIRYSGWSNNLGL